MTVYQNDPGKVLVFVHRKRGEAAEALCRGAWATEAKGRELVGKFNAYDEIYQEMTKSSSPDGDQGKDL